MIGTGLALLMYLRLYYDSSALIATYPAASIYQIMDHLVAFHSII